MTSKILSPLLTKNINNILSKDSTLISNSLLAKQKGQRGRPTLEAKRELELNPKKTVEQFWKDTVNQLPGRFQLLDKEKPSILLDNASNLDAFENLLLGIRLLHYQRQIKGITLVIGCNNSKLDMTEFLKLLRYFFKKMSGQVIVCPVEPTPGHKGHKAWNVEKVTNEIKSMKIKAKACANFKEAFEAAQKNGRAADLQKELERLFDSQNKSADKTHTSIPATFLRVTVEC